MLACRRLCKFSITADDVTVADALLLRFCKRTVELYGSDAITPNMHMHCHLASCIREFGPAHSFWLFPFERYNGILEGQPTNNRSIELQLMRRFQKDNMHLHLHHEAKQWPCADHFLQALPDPAYDISSPASFDESVLPGPKSVIGSLSSDSIVCLRHLYSKLYPAHKNDFQDGKISIPSTFRKYSTISWQGKCLSSSLNRNAKNPFVFVVPPFSFGPTKHVGFEGEERLAEIDFFLVHSVILPNSQEPNSHLLAYVADGLCFILIIIILESLFKYGVLTFMKHSQLIDSFWHLQSLHVLLLVLKHYLVNAFVLLYHLLNE